MRSMEVFYMDTRVLSNGETSFFFFTMGYDGRNWQVHQIITSNTVVSLSFSTKIVVQLSN